MPMYTKHIDKKNYNALKGSKEIGYPQREEAQNKNYMGQILC